MTTEELKLKVSLDTSGLKQDVAKVKTTMKGAEESLSDKGMRAGAKVTSESLGQVTQSLEKIRNLQFADIIIENFNEIRKGVQIFTSSFKLAGSEIAGIFSMTHFTETDTFLEGLGSMGTQVTEAFKSIKSGGKSLATSLKTAFGGVSASLVALIGSAIAVVATTRMAIQNAKVIAQVSREAQKIGLSTHAYEEWGYILKQNGVEIDKLSDFLRTLADEQNAVREGSEDIIQAFGKLGISANEAANMSQSDLFDKTVEGLQGVENQVERTGIAYKIFGEDAAQLMPILSMNSEQIAQLRRNYELLGGDASATLVQRSQQLQSSLGNLSQASAGVKNAITEALLPAIIAVVNWLTKAIAVIGMFFRAIFGTDTKKAETSTTKMSTGMGGYTSAVEGATAAVQKLKREQMGFDELNVLPGKDESSGGGGGSPSSFSSGGGGLGDMGLPTVEDMGLGKFQEWMDKYKNTLQMIIPIALTALGVILAVIGGVNGNIPLLINGIGLAGLGIAIGISNGAWERLAKGIKDMWRNLKDWFKTNVAPVFTKKFWQERFDVLKIAASEKLEEVKKEIDEKTKSIKDWFNKNIKPIFTKKYWQNKFDTIKAGATEKLDSAKETITGAWGSIKKWFNKNVKSKFTKKHWTEKFDSIRSAASSKLQDAKDAITGAWGSIKKWFGKNVKPKFTTTYWKNKFNTIKDGAKSAFNGIISIVETALNNIIKKINKLSWKIPDWVPKVGGQKFGFNFNTVSIPRLATGGIATRSVLANIGENGREAVLPLDNNTSWMDALADKIAARNSAPSKLFLQVDGKTFGWVAIDNINQITKQTGELQLAL